MQLGPQLGVFVTVWQAECGAAGFDLYDLRLMIHDRGVHSQHLSDAVIALHTSLQQACRDAGFGELLSTMHLLRCAQLCRQQLDLGVAVETALADAAVDTYVRCTHDRSVAKVRKLYCMSVMQSVG